MHKSSDNIYNFLTAEAQNNHIYQQQQQQLQKQKQSPLPKPPTPYPPVSQKNNDHEMSTSPISNRSRTNSANYTEKWLSTTQIRSAHHHPSYNPQANSITIPLPTHLELESAEPSPTQAFGPKITSSEDIPGTAMTKNLSLNLSSSILENGSAKGERDDDVVGLIADDTVVDSSHSNVMPDQFIYKQIISNEIVADAAGSKNSTSESSLSGSYHSSRKTSKRDSAFDEDTEQRRVSKQDREVSV